MFKKSAPVLFFLGSLLLVLPAAAEDNGKGGGKGTTSVVPTAGGSGKLSVDSLVQRYLLLAGSDANARSLVTGLRDGTDVTLTGTILEQVQVPVETQVTETVQVPVRVPAPPPAPPGTFITIFQPQTVTHTVTTYRTDTVPRDVTITFTPPTGNMGFGNVDIALALTESVLTQKNISTPNVRQLFAALMDASNGILQLRANGMGWGNIAENFGFKLK